MYLFMGRKKPEQVVLAMGLKGTWICRLDSFCFWLIGILPATKHNKKLSRIEY